MQDHTTTVSGSHPLAPSATLLAEQLRYYREAVFVPPPGPSTVELKRIAAVHQGALTASAGALDVSE